MRADRSPRILAELSFVAATSGSLADAEAYARRSERAARSAGWSQAELDSIACTPLLAWRGEDARTMHAAQRQRAAAAALDDEPANRAAAHGLMVMHLGRSRYPEAFAVARRAWELHPGKTGKEPLVVMIEAGVRCGRRATAKEALARLREWVGRCTTPLASALSVRCAAALADDARAAEALYHQALRLIDETETLTHRAYTRLVFGEWLRRQRRRAEARAYLADAVEMFTAIGAPAYGQRAAAELALTTRPIDEAGNSLQLTPQQRQVAELVVRGATNREVATRLFISAHTVNHHLRGIFRTVGVTSRRELRTALASRAGTSQLGQFAGLTGQEQAVACRVAAGASNREVAAELFLSPSTVDYHLRKVFRKLGISSRHELVRVVANEV
jgi:DNA-binding CsgD family transcriptional regulator